LNTQLLQSRDFLFYLMKGLEQLPTVKETVYRGIPGAHLAMVRGRYLMGSDVHWSAFNSTSTNIDKAKRFAQGPVRCYVPSPLTLAHFNSSRPRCRAASFLG
jgi:hypothetical protein